MVFAVPLSARNSRPLSTGLPGRGRAVLLDEPERRPKPLLRERMCDAICSGLERFPRLNGSAKSKLVSVIVHGGNPAHAFRLLWSGNIKREDDQAELARMIRWANAYPLARELLKRNGIVSPRACRILEKCTE